MATETVPAKGITLAVFDESSTLIRKACGVLGVMSQCTTLGDAEVAAAWAAHDFAHQALDSLRGLKQQGLSFLVSAAEKDRVTDLLYKASGIARTLHYAREAHHPASAAWAADDLLTDAVSTIDEGLTTA